MGLLVSFIVLTFVFMIGLDFMYNNRDVYVVCDVIKDYDDNPIHIITGVFTDKKKVAHYIDHSEMYILEVHLNQYNKLTREDLTSLQKPDHD